MHQSEGFVYKGVLYVKAVWRSHIVRLFDAQALSEPLVDASATDEMMKGAASSLTAPLNMSPDKCHHARAGRITAEALMNWSSLWLSACTHVHVDDPKEMRA